MQLTDVGWRRFFALGIDAFVLSSIDIVDEWIIEPSRPQWILMLWPFVSMGIVFSYSIVLHHYFGQTLGKKICGIRVRALGGENPSWRQSFLRSLPMLSIMTLLSLYLVFHLEILLSLSYVAEKGFPENMTFFAVLLWVWLGLDGASFYIDPHRRSVHDYFADTVVERVQK